MNQRHSTEPICTDDQPEEAPEPASPRELFIEDLAQVMGGNNAPIEPDDSMISKPTDNEGPQPGGDWGDSGGSGIEI